MKKNQRCLCSSYDPFMSLQLKDEVTYNFLSTQWNLNMKKFMGVKYPIKRTTKAVFWRIR